MAQKCLECLVVDGNYSKARIAGLFLGLISIAFFIWLIVLTVNLEKDDAAGTNAPQDFEWNKYVVTCSDKDGNKISTESKNTLKECQDSAKFATASFIFYTDDKSCNIYKRCGEKKRRVADKPGSTYKKLTSLTGEWRKYDMTCGKDKLSFQAMAMVDSLEKCKEEASKSVHGKFIFYSNSSLLKDSTSPGCYFYDKCDSTYVLEPEVSGQTYQRKIKN